MGEMSEYAKKQGGGNVRGSSEREVFEGGNVRLPAASGRDRGVQIALSGSCVALVTKQRNRLKTGVYAIITSSLQTDTAITLVAFYPSNETRTKKTSADNFYNNFLCVPSAVNGVINHDPFRIEAKNSGKP